MNQKQSSHYDDDNNFRIQMKSQARGSLITIEAQQEFRTAFETHYAPTKKAIYNGHAEFMETGSVLDRQISGNPETAQSEEDLKSLTDAYDRSQTKYIPQASVELKRIIKRVDIIFKLFSNLRIKIETMLM